MQTFSNPPDLRDDGHTGPFSRRALVNEEGTIVFKKILVALDRSPQTSVVFDKAVELAQMQGSSLILFSCLSLETEQEASTFLGVGTLGDVDLYGTYRKLRHESLQKDLEQVRSWLQTYAREAESQQIPVELDCRVGTPSSWICDRARTWEADLIVLGRRGHSGLSEFLLGSVSNYVVHHAPCSVLVVQGVPVPEEESPATAPETSNGN